MRLGVTLPGETIEHVTHRNVAFLLEDQTLGDTLAGLKDTIGPGTRGYMDRRFWWSRRRSSIGFVWRGRQQSRVGGVHDLRTAVRDVYRLPLVVIAATNI